MNDDTPQDDQSTIQPLAEDNDTPSSPPTDLAADAAHDGASDVIDSTHPVTDSADNLDAHEVYDEGLAGATETQEPNAGNTVIGYDPAKDTRQQ